MLVYVEWRLPRCPDAQISETCTCKVKPSTTIILTNHRSKEVVTCVPDRRHRTSVSFGVWFLLGRLLVDLDLSDELEPPKKVPGLV